MKVLAITGKLAEKVLKQHVADTNQEIDVLTLPISVAAFITPEYAANYLKSKDLSSYDMILMPGAVQGDVMVVERTTGVPTFKGPIHAADIAISFMEGLELSKILSASDIANKLIKQRAEAEINKIKRDWREIYTKKDGLIIGSGRRAVPIGSSFPISVVAEIVNAPKRDLTEIIKLSKYYEAEGADIIDIGMLANEPMPKKISAILGTIHASVDLPISIDTLNETEILAAVDSGVDLILSLDAGNMDGLAEAVQDTPAVILPSNLKRAELAHDVQTRIKNIYEKYTEGKRIRPL